jgi:FkbM family methyltransferase
MALLEDQKTGILYRDQTFDLWIINESKSYFKQPLGLTPADVCLDIGGHIGCWAARAKLECPDCQVFSFEPEITNFDVLKENAAKFKFDAFNAAIVSDDLDGKKIPLYVNTKKNNALHSIIHVNGRPTQEVDGIGFSSILNEIKPTIIKSDTEGAEYLTPWNAVAESNVKLVIMELHLTKRGHTQMARDIADLFVKMGFKTEIEPNFEGKRWTTMARWSRT